MSPGVLTTVPRPLVMDFIEKAEEHEGSCIPYSEEEQRGQWNPREMVNPIFMSPTSVSTTHSDSIGDEAS
jgi:hypothetical protein